MLFNSAEYLLFFLPIAACLYFWLNRRINHFAGKVWLATISVIFYGWWSINYLWLIGFSILFNYGAALLLTRTARNFSRVVLGLAISGNILTLAYFKYADFFIATINPVLQTELPLLHLALPMGISFFTFTQIAFLVDAYRGKAREYNLVYYCLFVTYFPHLIAGPIIHHTEMMPQFASRKTSTPDWDNLYRGLLIMAIGLIKKTVLADSLAFAADEGFSSPTPPVFHNAWITSLSYTLQLYFDFSGYTDMAIGASLIFNIKLPDNFNSPYKATNIQDFWRRWHITLSRWLRDYIYIPLGGNRHGLVQMHLAVLITFLLGGLWHGPNWTFVVWGALHGTASVLHRNWQRINVRIPTFLSWAVTFIFINAAWVFFRASNLTSAVEIIKSMVGMNGFASAEEMLSLLKGIKEPDTWNPSTLTGFVPVRKILLLLPALLLVWLAPNSQEICNRACLSGDTSKSILLAGTLVGVALFYMLFMTSNIVIFIYSYF